ncbi:MAG: hypothetical protein AAGL49_00350, partial [Pseudomonadota bacterium]
TNSAWRRGDSAMHRIGAAYGQSSGPIRRKRSDNRAAAFAVCLTLIVQTAAVLVWVGSASERLKQMEGRLGGHPDLIERTARLETEVVYIRRSLDRIEAKLDQLRATSAQP